MLTRREILAGGIAGGLVTDSEAAAQQSSDRELREVATSVSSLRTSLTRALEGPSLSFGPVMRLRQTMEQFLRANGKFPDYIDIGSGVFFDMYDWHVRNRQQLVITRGTDNRYTMQFMFTTLVLRHETETAFIGHAYDKG